jgi:formylmethanofuran dehydrogenase subunit E
LAYLPFDYSIKRNFLDLAYVNLNITEAYLEDFETLLKGSAEAHGHLCPGQVIGVRMAILGCELIGLDEPSQLPQIKSLIVYVEIDRCATDAIAYVTGARLGRRSLKFINNGIMAATFVNMDSGMAFRVRARESSREQVAIYAPDLADVREQQLAAYKKMPQDVLFETMAVAVDVPYSDLPGPTRFKIKCESCGVIVRDKRELYQSNQVLCRICAGYSYFKGRA